MPEARRGPQLPNAAPNQAVAELLTLAMAEPTIRCHQYADRLGDRGYSIAQDSAFPAEPNSSIRSSMTSCTERITGPMSLTMANSSG
jgi:hypothetical protein